MWLLHNAVHLSFGEAYTPFKFRSEVYNSFPSLLAWCAGFVPIHIKGASHPGRIDVCNLQCRPGVSPKAEGGLPTTGCTYATSPDDGLQCFTINDST